jgi:predicted nucleic acid-binding protein
MARRSRSKPKGARDQVIVVDTSVWIDLLNGRDKPHVRKFRALLGVEEIVVGDLIVCEILQGLDGEQAARRVAGHLRSFEIAPMVGEKIAVAAARNFRALRRRGITVRRTIDLLIGTWCIENAAALLHNDNDFSVMGRHLGLVEVPVTA